MIPPFPLLAVTVGLAAGVTALANTSISQLTVTLDPTIQYLLPPSFSGNDSNSFFQTTDAGDQLSATASAPVISYATEFTGVVGSKPTFELVAKQESPFAIEMGIWVSDHNQVSSFNPLRRCCHFRCPRTYEQPEPTQTLHTDLVHRPYHQQRFKPDSARP